MDYSVITERVAIDPGLTGAIATCSGGHGGLCRWEIISMPLAAQSVIDSRALHDFLYRFNPKTTMLSIENLHNFGQAKTGRKQRGTDVHFENYGRVQAACEILGFEIDYIMPISWQTSADKVDKDSKEESIIKAIEWQPAIQLQLLKDGSKTVYSDGKAEAVLMIKDQLVRVRKPIKKGKRS